MRASKCLFKYGKCKLKMFWSWEFRDFEIIFYMKVFVAKRLKRGIQL